MRPRIDHIAATMTGELADCFNTKKQGVTFILQALTVAADGRHTRVYLTNGKLVSLQIAMRQPLLAASSNWHALASFAARYTGDGIGLLIDIGTTTCDLIPIVDSVPVTIGKTDPNRLLNGELIYTGVERSPVCAMSRWCRGAAEVPDSAHEIFATMWDVYLTLDDLPEEPNSTHMADRRPATKAAAPIASRTRSVPIAKYSARPTPSKWPKSLRGADPQKISLIAAQLIARLQQPPHTVVISGQGEFLARRSAR